MKPVTQQTQLDTVKAALLNHEPVNSVVMFKNHITRLSAIVKRLRDRGWPVITERDKANGLAHYRLPKDWKAGGDIEQSVPKCCNKLPPELMSETVPPLSAYIPIMKY